MWGGADCATSYLYEHIPAIDNLARDGTAEISAKSIGSVAAQTGKKLVLTETFGCSGYGVTPKELKLIADKQYVYAVDLMCQHLYNYTFSKLGKIDCPPSFGRIMPWNPSSISYYLMPIVAIFNVKPLKDTSYTLGLLAGLVMTFSTLVYSPMWIDFYQNSLTEYPFMQDMIANARIATWNSISMHGALLVGGVWLVASGDFQYEPKNCKFFLLGLAVLLCYGMVGHHFFVPDKNVFFIFKNELPFEITHIDFRLDYCILLAALLWVIYYALPYAVKNIPLRIKQKKLIESYYGK